MLTFDDIFRQTIDELFPPFLFITLFLRRPIVDFKFR